MSVVRASIEELLRVGRAGLMLHPAVAWVQIARAGVAQPTWGRGLTIHLEVEAR
jgi:hypothetical protein